MKPIPLWNGEIVIPGRPGLTEESQLPVGSMLGVHKWQGGCFGGHFRLYDVDGGWRLICTGCCLQILVPEEVRTYAKLRAFLEEDLAEMRRANQDGSKGV